MFRKISNYLTIISLALIVSSSTIFAIPAVPVEKTKVKTIRIDPDKDNSYYNEVIVNGGKDSYTMNVAANKELKVIIRAERPVSLKVTAPDGSNQSYSPERYFTLVFRGEGEHKVELEALSVSLYTLEVINQ